MHRGTLALTAPALRGYLNREKGMLIYMAYTCVNMRAIAHIKAAKWSENG